MAAQCRRFTPTFGHQRNYRAQAVIPAKNWHRSSGLRLSAPTKVTVASHWRMNNQLSSASPRPSNGAKAQRGRRFRRDVLQLGSALAADLGLQAAALGHQTSPITERGRRSGCGRATEPPRSARIACTSCRRSGAVPNGSLCCVVEPGLGRPGDIDQRLDGRARMVGRPVGAQGDDALQGDPDVDSHEAGVPGPGARTGSAGACPGVASRVDRTCRWCP